MYSTIEQLEKNRKIDQFFIQASWGCPKHQEFRLQFLFQYENAMAYRKSILRATGP
jgi:hypothetical protein